MFTQTSREQPLKVIFVANTNTMHPSPSWVEVHDGRALAQQVARLTELVHEHDLTEAHVYFTQFQWGPETCTESMAIDTERLVVGHGGFGLQAAIDDSGGKFESDTIDSPAFISAVEACTDAVLYFPPSEADALKTEIEAYQAEEEVTPAIALLVALVLKRSRPPFPPFGFPYGINSLAEAVSLVAESENVPVSESDIVATCAAIAPGNEGLKLYRQDPEMWRVCRNGKTARGSHKWSDALSELVCIEANEEERSVGVLQLDL
ncbi:hypothetical protein [Paraburkholderia sp.]|uniref:hypothetical protein n=1 Tax=Paraburkholderia sp. TaxID=1926495 RepID=UPI003C7D4C81